MSKGSKPRPYDKAKFDANFERIFGGPPISEVSTNPDGTMVRKHTEPREEKPTESLDTHSQRD